ncbi:phosphate acyltransferase PlsX [bacterium]|nr:phosphate acyltransferase PlsX [bacterium]
MTSRKLISIDGMGGDNAPGVVIDGLAAFASSHPAFGFILHGDEQRLRPLVEAHAGLPARVEFRHTDKTIAMDEKPSQALRPKGRNSSMWNAVEAVRAHEAVAAVSAGNTGALMAISKLALRTVEGLHRPALVGSWPTRSGVAAVLDLGADITADATQLVEFAIMGVAFARAVHHKPRPSVALLNIGSEDLKGHDAVREAARLLRAADLDLDFRGFVEGADISEGAVDVVVTDGFTGNVALKTAEGVAKMVTDLLREALTSSTRGKLGAAIAMPALRSFRDRLDPRRVNGAVFLGLNGVVVKSHGGADAVGFRHAIEVAADMGESRFSAEISAQLARLKTEELPFPDAPVNEETAK